MSEFDPTGEVVAVSVSETKGVRKMNVDAVFFKENFGIIGDAHAGKGARQVSLLAMESIEKMRRDGLDVRAGAFGENITTRGFDLLNLKPGDRIKIGEEVLLEVSQIGKDCPKPCGIYYRVGRCIMPQEGIFARVLKGGKVAAGEKIELSENETSTACLAKHPALSGTLHLEE
jgi:molybdopterin adenylyltransferase